MEDYIIGGGSVPVTGNYYYKYDMYMGDETYGTAYIQDMVRVVKTACTNKQVTLKYGQSVLGGLRQQSEDVNVSWPESLSEKKKAIRGLFELVVDTKGGKKTDDIYINNLSGYFQTENYTLITERKASFLGGTVQEGGLVSYFPVYDAKNFKNSGKGGDYEACADGLTQYVYGILSGDATLSGGETKVAEGPWGLVMMDYIGSAEKSKELVNLIMMNNFAGFELAEKKDENKAKTAKVPLNDEKISPELDVLINWD